MSHDDTVTLRELLEARFAAIDARTAALVESHAAVHQVAEGNVNRRLDEMNELRAQIEQERGVYVRRDQLDAMLLATSVEFRELAKANQARISNLEAQAQNWQGRFWMAGAVLALLIALTGLLIKFF